MKRARKEKNHSILSTPARSRHGGISTRDIDIPLDLMIEVLKKLPSKSLMRFQCVSKLWSSIISSNRNFIDSMVTLSLNQPPRDAHLIFPRVHGSHIQCLLVLWCSSCLRNIDKETLLLPGQIVQYVRGLIFFGSNNRHVASIYNHTTRQLFRLPKMESPPEGNWFFGYDPLENQYKTLFIPRYSMEQACQVFTLGDPIWRTIQGVRYHCPLPGAICIKGAIYYRAMDYTSSIYKLMSFDVRSEEFCHVAAPDTLMDHFSVLINYQGKLGFVCCVKRVEIWVMEDGDQTTQKWSKIFFYEMEGFEKWNVSGVTRDGEIVFVNAGYLYDDKLRVLYYDPKRNSMRFVDLESTYPRETRRFCSLRIATLPDHVENTMRFF